MQRINEFFFLVPLCAALAQGQGMMQNHMKGGRMMGVVPETITSDSNPITAAKVNLGRMLFYDARLSKNNDVSCNSCHDLARYGVDGKPVSTGDKSQRGNRNSPTVYNAAAHLAQFWDGRAATIEDQAKGPVLNPVEMAMENGEAVAARLRNIPGYVKAFQEAFPGQPSPVTFDNMALAIGAFERGLVTRGSRWDRFLQGDRNAITEQEMSGHHEFMHGGCATCHNGAYVGGSMFQKLGAQKPWPSAADPGRFGVTQSAADRMVFKVPSLRNVAHTGPYFHDGSVAKLEDAVRKMGEFQLNTNLSDVQVAQIVSWLNTLTGDLPHKYIERPVLPK